MPLSDAFLAGIQPGIDAFTNYQPPPAPSLIPGVVNTGGALAPPVPITAPPPPDLTGGASMQPGAPVASQMNMSVQPPAPPAAPEPPPAQGPVMVRGYGASPGHEVAKAGPTQVALLNERDRVQRNAVFDQSEAAQKAAKAEYTGYEAQKEEAQTRIQAAQAAQVAENEKIAAAQSHIDQASAPLNKPIEDFWSDKSVGSKAMTALSVAIGAFGAAFGKTGVNPGMQILQASMDQDIKTKQMNYQRGVAVRDGAQQDFNNLVRQIGMNPAKEQYEAALKSKMAAQAGMLAAATKVPDAQAAAQKIAADLQAESLKHKAEALLGYQPPTKGQDMVLDPNLGVMVPRSEYGQYKMKGALQDREQAGQLAIAEAKEGGKQVQEGTKFIANKLQESKVPAALAAVDAAAAAQTPSKDNPDAQAGLGFAGKVVRGIGGKVGYRTAFGQNALNREQTWEQSTAEVMHSLGGVLSKEEFARYDSMLRGADTVEDRANTLALIRSRLNAQVNAIKAGAGPEAAATYDANLAAVTPPKINSRPAK